MMALTLPEGTFSAYLFDCDGTIADSMPMHYVAWKKALAEWGCVFDEELFYAWGGMTVAEIVGRLNARDGLAMPAAIVAEHKETFYVEMLPQLKGVPEVMAIIVSDYGRVPFAVVSGSTRESVVASLSALGILDRFETLVCAGEYAKGKPDPEPFLMAARQLGVKAENCLVFEDAEPGIRAAVAAGMGWVKIEDPRVRAAG
jgi:HAD superfamily hydrolase (TIGR01509 family)